MSNVPVEVIVAAFQNENGAKEALKDLKRAESQGLIKIDDAAVISKDANGKLHIKETADMSTGKGAGIGAVIGGVVGLLAGPIGIGLGAAAGAAIGGVAAHGDAGIKDERLEKIGEGLEPGTSAIVAIVEHKWVAAVQEQLREEAADVMAQGLSDDIHQQLISGKEIVISAVAAEGGSSISRTTAGEDEVQQDSYVITEDGVMASSVVATKDSVAAETVIVTDDAVEIIEAAADKDGAAIIDAVITEDEAVIAAAVIEPDEESDEADAPEQIEAEESSDEGESDSEDETAEV